MTTQEERASGSTLTSAGSGLSSACEDPLDTGTVPVVNAVFLRIALVLSAATGVAVLPCGVAHAQTASQIAGRRLLLDQAEQARTAGRHAEALDLAQRAGALEMTPSLRYFIAQEEAAVGRFAAALGDGERCAREADRDTTIRNREALLRECRALVESVRTRVGRVVIQVPTPVPDGLTVTVEGEVLDPALYGVASVVSPGHVVIEARARGRRTFRAERDVAAAATESVQVELAAESGQDLAASDRGASGSDRRPQGTSVARPVGAVIAGIGLVALGVGVGLWVDTGSAYDRCARVGCTLAEQPRTEETAGIALMYAGGALAVAGAAIFLIVPALAPSGRDRASVRAVWCDPASGVGVSGVF